MADCDEPAYRERLAAHRATDRQRTFTHSGPHRDDVRFLLDGRDLRDYGSQGEQRTAVLALLLAERAWRAQEGGVVPMLLLDDVMSELDADRRRALMGLLAGGGQTVLTTTDLHYFTPEELAGLTVVGLGEEESAVSRDRATSNAWVRSCPAVLGRGMPAERRLAAVWPDVVGPEVARNAQPRTLRAGRLVVATSSSVWAQTLQHMAGEILPRLNEALAAGLDGQTEAVCHPRGDLPSRGMGSWWWSGVASQRWMAPRTAEVLKPMGRSREEARSGSRTRRRLTAAEEAAIEAVRCQAGDPELCRLISKPCDTWCCMYSFEFVLCFPCRIQRVRSVRRPVISMNSSI